LTASVSAHVQVCTFLRSETGIRKRDGQTRALLRSALVGLTRHLLNISTREPTLLSLLDKGTIPPSAHGVFGRMSLNHYILDE
jgi:hypothetical protein